MNRSALAACALAAVLVLAGCGGTGPGTDAPATGTTPGGTTPNETTTPNGTTGTITPGEPVEHASVVFDQAIGSDPVVEGGLAGDDDPGRTYFAALLSTADRLDRSALPEEARTFVEETDFESASLVVIQATPKSSVPDYRVESVTRSDGRIEVRINDSSESGTDDLTVETVLLRVAHDGDPPSVAAVTTQDGDRFDTDDGVVTYTSDRDESDAVAR